MKDYRALYAAETAKLQAIADSLFTGRHHMLENFGDTVPLELQEPVLKILRRQVELLILINRQTQLAFFQGK